MTQQSVQLLTPARDILFQDSYKPGSSRTHLRHLLVRLEHSFYTFENLLKKLRCSAWVRDPAILKSFQYWDFSFCS